MWSGIRSCSSSRADFQVQDRSSCPSIRDRGPQTLIRGPAIPIRVVPGVGRALQRGPPPSGRERRPISGGASVACTSCVASLRCPAPRTRHRLAIGERLIAEPVHVAPHPRIGNERQPGQQTPIAGAAETWLMLPHSYVWTHRHAHRAGVPRVPTAPTVSGQHSGKLDGQLAHRGRRDGRTRTGLPIRQATPEAELSDPRRRSCAG